MLQGDDKGFQVLNKFRKNTPIPAFSGFRRLFWRWRESNPRPNTRNTGLYRFNRVLYCRGGLGAAVCGPSVFRKCLVVPPPKTEAETKFPATSLDCVGSSAPQGGGTGFRVPLFMQRERNCRSRQLNCCRMLGDRHSTCSLYPEPYQSKPVHPRIIIFTNLSFFLEKIPKW